MFITDCMIDSILNTLSLDRKASLDSGSVSEIPRPNFMHPPCGTAFISSCRGFIFLRNFKKLYLWNPSTGLHKQIPWSPNYSNDAITFDDYHFCFGFGYDQLRDDYVLVSISFVYFNDKFSRLEFFSLRDNTWKELEVTHFPYMYYNMRSFDGSLFNGVIHWLTFGHDRDAIIAFDLMGKKLLEMEMPFPASYLWVFGDFLSGYTSRKEDIVEIWVMKEYNVHSSWTKVLVLRVDGIPSKFFFPICSTESGDIIGTDGDTTLFKYNDKGQLLEHNSFWEGSGPIDDQMIMYTESLLSLSGDNVQA
jgi:F-box interacting protein